MSKGLSKMPIEKMSFLEKMHSGGVLTWGFLILITILGATARYLKGLKNKPFKIIQLLIENIVSAFVAIITGLICGATDLDYMTSFALIGLASHHSTRALFVFQNFLDEKLNLKTSQEKPPKEK